MLAASLTLLLPLPAAAQCNPQQVRLQPLDSAGLGIAVGSSVSMSADGNSAIVSAPFDNLSAGAGFVFTRSGGAWPQQGPKLVPTGAVGQSQFGSSVSISGDGNTAIVGADHDNSSIGAAYIFVRSGSSWSQQVRLTPASGVGTGHFGGAVFISEDGATAAVGAPNDNGNTGAVYVFQRSGSTWSQPRPKIAPATGTLFFGFALALPPSGGTLLAGAIGDTSTGGAYIFTRSQLTGAWSQQARLLPADAAGNPGFGGAVALAASGTTAVIGGRNDNGNAGAAFVFTRSGATWSQAGPKLTSPACTNFGAGVSINSNASLILAGAVAIGSDTTGAAFNYEPAGPTWIQRGPFLQPTSSSSGNFGEEASLSRDGSTAVIGAPQDGPGHGAAYIFSFPSPIALTQQPTPAAVHTGEDASLSITATASVPPTFQWRRDGVNLANGPTGNGSTIAGATTSTLTIQNTTAPDNGGAYDCVISTPCQTARSNAAGLSVIPTCGSSDFNGDGDFATDADIEAFFRVLAGGSC
jgi:hypothetical protein